MTISHPTNRLRLCYWAILVAFFAFNTMVMCDDVDRGFFVRNSGCAFAFPSVTRSHTLTPTQSFATSYRARHSIQFSENILLKNEVQRLRRDVFQQRCSSKSTIDLFLNEGVRENEIDDLLAFKKVFDSEVEFIDIDFGVKGILKIQLANQTEESEVISNLSYPSLYFD